MNEYKTGKMKKIIAIIACVLTCVQTEAQKISFKSESASLGTTLWKSPVTATFKFTNKEKTSLRVLDVDPGCGCTSVEWTKDDVVKGKWGEIKVTYDGQQLGHYDRYIEVFTNASSHPVRLRIFGVISTELEINVDSLFPYIIDNVRVSTNNIEFPDLHAGDSAKVSFDVYNAGDRSYTLQVMHLPSYVTMKASPEKIGRNRFGTIELTAHGDDVPDLGLTQTSIYIPRYPGDKVGTDNEMALSIVKLSHTPVETSGKLTPKLTLSTTDLTLKSHGAIAKLANKIGFKETTLGKVGIKTKMQGQVTITNRGLAPLNITNVQAFNQAITVSLPKRVIEPGVSVNMKIVIDSRFLGVSKAQPRVLIITDDPKMPKAVINVHFE